jgi:SAM-dependent methyltransferase
VIAIPPEGGATNMTTDIQDLPREMQAHFYPIQFEMEEKHWWYLGRRRILEMITGRIKRDLGLERPRILDVGCGTGANLIMLAQFGEAHGLDVSSDALEFCATRGLNDVSLGAAEELPYPDASFDLVTALDVIEHLDDDLAGMKEIHRVLRPNGRALLFVPAFMFLWGVQDEVSHHRRRYRLPELERVVTAAGFTLERATYANIVFFLPIAVMRFILRRTGAKPDSEFELTPGFVNWLFTKLFGLEAAWLKRWNLPFGVSALVVARRNKD